MTNQLFIRMVGNSVFGLDTKSTLGPVWIAFIGSAGLLAISIAIWLIGRRRKRRKEKKDFFRSPALLSAIARMSDEEKADSEGHEGHHELHKNRPDWDDGNCTYRTLPLPSHLLRTPSPTLNNPLPRTPELAHSSPCRLSPVVATLLAPPRTLSPATSLRPNQSSSVSLRRQIAHAPSPTQTTSKENIDAPSPALHSPQHTSPPGITSHIHFPLMSDIPFSSATVESRTSVVSDACSSENTQSLQVRQLFTPILSDELSVTSTGELLIVLDTFDDEWCAVGRESPGSGMQLGVVPLWVFLQPVKGIQQERPMRTTSLGVGSQDGTRCSIMDWYD